MNILGISALYHGSAAALVRDGEIVAAAEEERFTRVKLDRSLPVHAVNYCLKAGGNLTGEDLDAVVYYDDPLLTMHRFLCNVSAVPSSVLLDHGTAPIFGEKLWAADSLRKALGALGKEDRLFVSRHHLSHAASAFFPSPFSSAAILTLDGVGEWNTTTIGKGEGNKIRLLKKQDYPHSLGLFYSAFTYFCGFRVNFGEYKLMGLSPYGRPVYKDLILDRLLDLKEDGSFRLDLSYFDFQNGGAVTGQAFDDLFGGPRRLPESAITRRELDLAASCQAVTEEVIFRLAKTAKELTGEKNLVMAGGVALNCAANGKLDKAGIFDRIWIQPAAGDAGGALGAALAYYYQYCGQPRVTDPCRDSMKGAYLGPVYSDEEVKTFLDGKGIPYHTFTEEDGAYLPVSLRKRTAELLEQQKVVGLFRGRMEYGPRALGSRSILADPRSPEMQSKLNLKIKYRESFRPFAPAVLKERAADYFELDHDSPYMLFTARVRDREDEAFFRSEFLTGSSGSAQKDTPDEPVDLKELIRRKRSQVPAVTHVDYSARVQTVDPETNPDFYGILKAFEERTGCGVLINTSFNVRGEPIVMSPEDAYNCFMNTEMDALVMNRFLLLKEEQPEGERRRDVYELD